jgi:beta-barrel assembly-enhancing protease
LMKIAGYDPRAAVTLQETFVKLSAGRKQGWLDGFFASHPPSVERVSRNRDTAQQLGEGGDLGADRYAARLAPLRQMQPAYDKYDQALVALQKKDIAGARALAGEAVRLVPREAQFHQLLGDIDLGDRRNIDSLPHYEKAMELNPGYFGSWLGAGLAQYRLGNKARAGDYLARSMALLPTAPAALYLGNLSRDAGDTAAALALYQTAATSQSGIGQEAMREAVLLDLPTHPENYVAAALRMGSDGKPLLVIQNRAAVPLGSITITPVLVNANGAAVREGRPVTVTGPLKTGEQIAVDAGLNGVTAEQLQIVRLRVDSARLAP